MAKEREFPLSEMFRLLVYSIERLMCLSHLFPTLFIGGSLKFMRPHAKRFLLGLTGMTVITR